MRSALGGDSQGFTIVEVVVSIVMVAIASYTLTLLFSSVQDSQRSSQYAKIAADAARSQVDKLQYMDFADIVDDMSFTDELPSMLPNATGVVDVPVAPPANAYTSKQADVTVSYTVGSRTRSVVMTTYIDPPEENE